MWLLDESAIQRAESMAAESSPRFMEPLREIPLNSFAGLLLEMPSPAWPALSSRLPSMAPGEVQKTWTGAEGWDLLRQTLGFLRVLDHASLRLTGAGLSERTILDFGCGWGRMLRLLPWFTPAERLYGCDPWDASIDLCRRHQVWGQLALSDYLPTDLPFGDVRFDIAFAFSVFTHTSARALRSALAAIRPRMSPGGLLVATIRPIEYWRMTAAQGVSVDVGAMEEAHRQSGFAFRTRKLAPIDGDITFGDTSMTLAYLASHPGWRIVGYDQLAEDVMQVVVFMLPV